MPYDPCIISNSNSNSNCRWSEFLALFSLSTTLFLFLQTRDLSMQLSEERMRHTGEGGELLDTLTQSREGDTQYREGEKGRDIHRDLSTAQEREHYGKVNIVLFGSNMQNMLEDISPCHSHFLSDYYH